jgi:UDP-3-O-[3-hydroxymyristoyl] glucosamine N-acyltransferase
LEQLTRINEYHEIINAKPPLVSLENVSAHVPLNIVRDTEFYNIGKVPTHAGPRIVPCAKPNHIEEALRTQDIVGIITTPSLADNVPDHLGLVIDDAPLKAAYRIHEYLCDVPNHYWKEFDSYIDETATIHPDASIAEKNVIIGPHSRIGAGTIIAERSVIGAHCDIGLGVTIGGDAFEVVNLHERRSVLRQGGGVRIGDHVTIQSQSNIVRATFAGFTEIGDETCIDALVHVAHDCVIGKRVTITACAEISGRVNIKDNAWLGPNCSIVNGLTIGEGSKVTIGSTVTRNVDDGQTVTGNFAIEHQKWLIFVRSLVK